MACAVLHRVPAVQGAHCHVDNPVQPERLQGTWQGKQLKQLESPSALSSSICSIANTCLPELAPSILQCDTHRNKERFCQTFQAAQKWDMGEVWFLSWSQLYAGKYPLQEVGTINSVVLFRHWHLGIWSHVFHRSKGANLSFPTSLHFHFKIWLFHELMKNDTH